MSTTKFPNGVTVTTFPSAPAGFDPHKADPASLLRYGYPRRPDESPELLKRWRRLVGKPLVHIEPSLRMIERKRRGPRLRVTRAGIETFPNWSGAVVFAPAGSIFDSVAGQWRVPNPDPAVDDGTLYFSSSWIGIDGDGSPDVFQAGVDCDAQSTSGGVQRTIFPWFEWFPADPVEITNLPVAAGDLLTCLLWLDPTRVLETGTTFAPETDGVWLMADFDRDQNPDLVFIKTGKTPTGKVEVHIASGGSGYKTRILETATTFASETDGTWLMADFDGDGFPDLVFIKTSNTSSGKVEVHIASGKSKYQTRILETATTFAPETDGVWLMADFDHDGIPDLVLIKTSNTGTGKVEFHIASGKSKYQTRILETATTFAPETDGTWLMADFDRDGIPDLVFIKTSNTATGQVEVHIASGASKYQTRILETATTFAPETDGVWLMTDFNPVGVPDLTFIKTSNTGTGTVEVHIASGAGANASGSALFRNESQGISTSLQFSAPSGISLVGNCAEWIVERPEFADGTLTNLANYHAVKFNGADATATGGITLQASAGDTINMTDDSGNTISVGEIGGPDVVNCTYTRKVPFQTRILETATTFAPETDGTWLMADFDRDGIPDLVFVKTSNTSSGKVEVHIASGASKYKTRILETGTTFAPETDGVWLMADFDRDGIPDLVFIKTSNTGTGKVEVHIASGASKYKTRILETGTTFAPETDGTWLMADFDRDGIPDLVFIKTSNTGTGKVEVHIASGASKYKTRILETGTTFAPETDGVWLMVDFDHDGIPDLVFVKTGNTGTGQVEVHIASGVSKYKTRILDAGTTFAPETDGTWLMADFDRDGIPDLVFIKTGNTPTGKVEVHIASGA